MVHDVTRTTQEFPRVSLRGLPITACTTNDVRQILAQAIQAPAGICRIATLNLNFLRLADERPAVRTALLACEHRLADGWPLVELARRAGQPLPERVAGSTLVPLILAWAREENWRVALIGGRPDTYAALQRENPWRSVICGHWLPAYPDAERVGDPELCQQLRAAGAQIVLVALGCPKQEFWLHANLPASGAPAGMGVGGSFEFLARTRRRAPLWVQKLRLEFVWRFLQEPRRLGQRYVHDYLYWRRIRRQPGIPAAPESAADRTNHA